MEVIKSLLLKVTLQGFLKIFLALLMIKRRCQKEVRTVLSQFPCILWWRGLSLTWDPASAGDARRVLTRGGCETKEKVSSRAPLPESEVGGP